VDAEALADKQEEVYGEHFAPFADTVGTVSSGQQTLTHFN